MRGRCRPSRPTPCARGRESNRSAQLVQREMASKRVRGAGGGPRRVAERHAPPRGFQGRRRLGDAQRLRFCLPRELHKLPAYVRLDRVRQRRGLVGGPLRSRDHALRSPTCARAPACGCAQQCGLTLATSLPVVLSSSFHRVPQPCGRSKPHSPQCPPNPAASDRTCQQPKPERTSPFQSPEYTVASNASWRRPRPCRRPCSNSASDGRPQRLAAALRRAAARDRRIGTPGIAGALGKVPRRRHLAAGARHAHLPHRPQRLPAGRPARGAGPRRPRPPCTTPDLRPSTGPHGGAAGPRRATAQRPGPPCTRPRRRSPTPSRTSPGRRRGVAKTSLRNASQRRTPWNGPGNGPTGPRLPVVAGIFLRTHRCWARDALFECTGSHDSRRSARGGETGRHPQADHPATTGENDAQREN